MLKGAIYLNVLLLLIISIIYMVIIFNKKFNLKKLRHLIVIYMIFNFISICICNSGIVDTGWDFIILFPISVITFIIQIVSIICIAIKLKKDKKTNYKNISLIYSIGFIIIPVLMFIIPYVYELYVINNCTYLLKYNYQNGIIQSDDTYIAIINNKPVTVTLQNNLIDRVGISTEPESYNIVYTNNNIDVDNNIVKNIALDAKERISDAKGAFVDYFYEGNYAIIELLDEEDHGTVLGKYFYYNDTFIKEIDTHGDLESITYYK